MSYQDYAQLGKGTRRNAERQHQSPPQPRRSRAGTVDRPYTGSTASFSIPRASTQHSNSSSTSTASISPSNSASQQDTASFTTGSTAAAAAAAANHQATWAKMKELELGIEKQPTLVDVPLPWRPSYLQRKILSAFVGIFAGLVVALEALGDFSARNDGLGPGATTLRYAWAYAPAALLTLLAALWGRVEHQAKSAAPWIRMSKGPAPAEKTLLLDYVGMIRPVAIFKAIANRDVVVACAVTVSLALRALVVLSTALVTISVVGARRQTVPITLHTAFVDDLAGLTTAGPLSLYTMLGLQRENVSLPDGASSRFAYQQFLTDLPAGTAVDVPVEGFSADLECQAAQLAVTGVQYIEPDVQFNTTIDIAECSITMPINSALFVGADDSNTSGAKFFARFGSGGCGGSVDLQDQRIVVVFGMETIDRRSLPTDPAAGSVPITGAISISAQLLCKPTYTISRLDARKNGTDLMELGLLDPPQNKTLEKVQPWDVAQAVFDSFRTDLAAEIADTTPPYYLPEFVNVDPPMYLALGILQKVSDSLPPPSTFLNGDALEALARDYFQQHSALIASKAMTEQIATLATGTAILQGERVVVRFLAVQLMVGLLAIAIILTIVAAFLVPRKGFLPRDPNTIIDTSTLIAHSKPLLQGLRGAGGGSSTVLRERLGGSDYYIGVEPYENPSSNGAGYFKIFGSPSTQEAGGADFVQRTNKFPFPIALHPVVRVAAFIMVVALIVCLEIPLRMSQSNGGLGDAVDEASYVHFLWTAAPALVLLLFAAYFAYADFTTRALAPYAALGRGGSFEASVNLNYLDKATPLVLYESVKSRNIAVAAAAIALLTSSLLVASIAPVFSVATVPAVSRVQLITQDASPQGESTADLKSCTDCPGNGALVASLILNANMSYPAFTYEGLSFPTLGMRNVLGNDTVPDDAVISASLTAVRPVMSCRVFKRAEITTNLALDGNTSPLEIDLAGESPQGDTGSAASTFTISTAGLVAGEHGMVIAQDAFFGATDRRQITLDDGTIVSHWVYTWGQLADANTTKTTVKSISAMACNETVEQVEAKATFFGASLTILPSNPPVVASSAVPVTIAAPPDSSNFYNQLVNLSTPHLLDPFFASLVASRYAIAVTDLGNSDPAAAQHIADVIVRQHNIIRTQVLREFSRASLLSSKIESNATGAATGDSTAANIPALLTEDVLRPSTAATATTRATGADTTSPLRPLTARRRVVQDVVATRVLQGLLGTTALLGLLSWIAFPGPANALPRTPGGVGGGGSIASMAALLADGNTFGLLGRTAEWQPSSRLRELFMDGLHVSMGFRLGWEAPRRRRREETLAAWGMNGSSGGPEELFGIGAVRTGGWGGGEAVGLGLQARVGFGHRSHVKDWGWRT